MPFGLSNTFIFKKNDLLCFRRHDFHTVNEIDRVLHTMPATLLLLISLTLIFFKFEPSFIVPWLSSQDFDAWQIPVTRRGFEL